MRGRNFDLLTRLRVRAGLAEKGLRRRDVNRAMDGYDERILAMASVQSGVTVPNFAEAALGDGTIIKAIIEFFNSEAGKKLIDALIQLLLSFIG